MSETTSILIKDTTILSDKIKKASILIVDNTIIINTAINIKKVKTNGICKSPSLYY